MNTTYESSAAVSPVSSGASTQKEFCTIENIKNVEWVSKRTTGSLPYWHNDLQAQTVLEGVADLEVNEAGEERLWKVSKVCFQIIFCQKEGFLISFKQPTNRKDRSFFVKAIETLDPKRSEKEERFQKMFLKKVFAYRRKALAGAKAPRKFLSLAQRKRLR